MLLRPSVIANSDIRSCCCRDLYIVVVKASYQRHLQNSDLDESFEYCQTFSSRRKQDLGRSPVLHLIEATDQHIEVARYPARELISAGDLKLHVITGCPAHSLPETTTRSRP